MKKILAMILALAMILSMSAFAFASEYSNYNGATSWSGSKEESGNVEVTVVAATTVYHVVVAWDNMAFTYNPGAWNPTNHSYDQGTWSTGSAEVTVTNHSNATVNTTIMVDAKDVTDITVTSNYNSVDKTGDQTYTKALESADVASRLGDSSKADSMIVTITPSGKLDNNSGANTVLATITVTLAS